jgi:hypothetical protein
MSDVVATISATIASVANNPWRTAAAQRPDVLGKVSAPVSTQTLEVEFGGPLAAASWRITLARTVEPTFSAVICDGAGAKRFVRVVIPTCLAPISPPKDSTLVRVPYTADPCVCTVDFLDANGTVISTASTLVGG